MFSYFCLTFLLVLGWILSASLTYFVPSRTFFLAPISSVYMETIGSSRSGILAQSSSPPTWTCQVHPPLPGGSSSGHWLRYNDQVHRRKVGKQEKRAWNLPGGASLKSGIKIIFYTYFLQSEFCEIKKKYDAARERLENDVKEITELIQVCYLTSSVHCTCKLVIFMPPLLQEREGAYTDYQDASALKYSHVPSASRFAFSQKSRIVRRQISLVWFINFLWFLLFVYFCIFLFISTRVESKEKKGIWGMVFGSWEVISAQNVLMSLNLGWV